MPAGPSRVRRGIGSVALLVVSSALSILAALGLLAGIARWLGAHHPDMDFVEPRPVLWEEDLEIGFRNRPHLDHTIFGNLTVRTNSAGFRADAETLAPKPEGRFRIIGIGDSVTWGTRVSGGDTFLAVLERALARRMDDVEVVNAGVVGFSSHQQRVLLSRIIGRYAPDVVIVNLHTNDYLPTENPYGNIRATVGRQLEEMDSSDTRSVLLVRRILQEPRAWNALRMATLDPKRQQALRALLIDRPIRAMARIAAEHDARLVYLLIPPTREIPADRALRLQVRALLWELGVGFVDFSTILEPGKAQAPERDFEEGRMARMLGAARISDGLAWLSLETLDPLPRLRNLSRLKGIEAAHEQADYIDRLGHLSRRGHRVVAQEILAYLALNGMVPPLE